MYRDFLSNLLKEKRHISCSKNHYEHNGEDISKPS